MLKKYQVAEHENGLWGVHCVAEQYVINSSFQTKSKYMQRAFETAAEAQELADQLNEQEQDK